MVTQYIENCCRQMREEQWVCNMETKIIINKHYQIGAVSPFLYGSFAEHMGRVVYSGIYEPDHSKADEDGFRTDVLKSVKNMGIRLVRYPGGNFVSGYHWEDGVGPRKDRPRKVELAWKSIETNEFGTDEFMKWCRKAGVEPMLCVNLGTRGMEDALHYLEYCNFPGGTYWSDLRIRNGHKEPYGVKYWCLGNEMDGPWQIGHKEAKEYGRIAAETGKAMKALDPSICLVASGSSLSSMPTFPEWDLTVLEEAYEVIDYLSLHQYYGGQEKGTKAFLSQSEDMEHYIETIRSAVRLVKARKRSDHEVKLAMDEWGVWSRPSNSVNEELKDTPWQVAPAISEQIYTLEDALLFASMMMVMLRNADSLKIACQALIANISSCIMTERGGESWLQTTYYPFYYISNETRGGVSLKTVEEEEKSADIDHAVVWNEDKRQLSVFLVNREEKEKATAFLQLEDFNKIKKADSIVLTANDPQTTNRENHQAVIPVETVNFTVTGDRICVELPPLSFDVLRIITG